MDLQILKLQQERAAMKNFKSQIYEAIQELTDGKNNINNAITEFEKVYTGQEAKEKRAILDEKVQEIDSVINELQESFNELKGKINYIDSQTEARRATLRMQ